MVLFRIVKENRRARKQRMVFQMAKDHFAYINIFRKCIDEVEEYKKQLWLMVMDSKVDHSVKVQALKELHSLSKTYTLLIKDIPFVTNISKYYDKDVLNSNYNDLSYSKGTYSNNDNKNYTYR